MRRILTALLILGFTLIGTPAALAATTGTEDTSHFYQNSTLIVEDTAGVLDLDQLVPAIDALSFHEPTRVAIYTRHGTKTENLNEELLRFARSTHSEWISPDGQKWADGLFIFVLDPTGRQQGTYFGEDRKLSANQRDDIQEAVRPLLQEAQWTDASIKAVEKAAALMNRPWYLNPGLIFGGIVAFLGATIAVIAGCVARDRTRKRALKALAAGDAAFANVSLDLSATELHARTIPESSSYGHLVLEKYRTFSASYRELAASNAAVHALTARQLRKKQHADACEDYAAAATSLDALDDVIADTNDLMNKYAGWAAAWDRQCAPFKDDLDGLDALFADNLSKARTSSIAALTAFRDKARGDLEEWAAALAADTMRPEQALDLLAAAREQLARLLEYHAEAVIARYSKTTTEAQLMRRSMNGTAKDSYGAGDRYGNAPNSILGTVNPAVAYVSVMALTHNLHAGHSAVKTHRAESSTGGGSTGYGSGGGSFSGSGSSSSF